MASDAETATTSSFLRKLDLLVRARYPLLYLVSCEEQRAEEMLQNLARGRSKELLTWSITRGLRKVSGGRAPVLIEGTQAPKAALAAVAALANPSLVVLKDLHAFLDDAEVVRWLRELSHTLKQTQTTVILLSPQLRLPPDLEKEVTVVDVPLPGFDDLRVLLRDIVTLVQQSGRATVDLERTRAEELIRAAQGLTLNEAENVFARAIADDGRLDASDIAMVLEEKQQIVRKSGLLEYFPPSTGLDHMGGLELLKEWLVRRKAAFSDAARAFGLPEPKGILLLGVQGCGKSLTAKCVAAEWQLPLLRLDVGRIFSSFMGSSEQNLRRAIAVAESLAPAVLWIDEVEKGLSGIASSGASDAGVTARVFGNLLTWLQEKTAPVFVVATANRIDLLPPEMIRKGRFDEIFFVDLPSEPERAEIFRIHLQGKKRDPENFDIDALAMLTKGFSGAEIEQVIVAALYDAFNDGVDVAQAHIESAVQSAVPLSRTMPDEIERLRSWAATRTRPASVPVLYENVAMPEEIGEAP
ncbi:MAG: AAA family ATPase [Polyangiaceae bacterium]|nr:AAA family ATPase [Polyangiaceae bacterium]